MTIAVARSESMKRTSATTARGLSQLLLRLIRP